MDEKSNKKVFSQSLQKHINYTNNDLTVDNEKILLAISEESNMPSVPSNRMGRNSPREFVMFMDTVNTCIIDTSMHPCSLLWIAEYLRYQTSFDSICSAAAHALGTMIGQSFNAKVFEDSVSDRYKGLGIQSEPTPIIKIDYISVLLLVYKACKLNRSELLKAIKYVKYVIDCISYDPSDDFFELSAAQRIAFMLKMTGISTVPIKLFDDIINGCDKRITLYGLKIQEHMDDDDVNELVKNFSKTKLLLKSKKGTAIQKLLKFKQPSKYSFEKKSIPVIETDEE